MQPGVGGDVQEIELKVLTEERRQCITGIGGSFTDATAFLLHQMSPAKRRSILDAYFGEDGANYSLTRTHMNSSDFSRHHYSYAPVAGDQSLTHFDIAPDRDFLIPTIHAAQEVSGSGFRIIASPWTAPPWMKDNQSWIGGRLLPEFRDTWAHFYVKYARAYEEVGIPIWGFTVVNEPHGNGENWESMHFTPDEMTQFVQDHLGPTLEANGLGHIMVLGYDQNRDGLKEWVDVMFQNKETQRYFDGTAVHWYDSTCEVFPEALEHAHFAAPDKYLIQTEACCDAQVPVWGDDDWYWRSEATDWGFTWREPEKKHLHPPYAPVHRYARDIIGCLNHWVDGWVDWNMVLDRQGGPNWFENWCTAPVIVDPTADEVYFTPLYDVMCHFSKFIRPGSFVLKSECNDSTLQATAVATSKASTVLVVFNPTAEPKSLRIRGMGAIVPIALEPESLYTLVITSENS
jgi:glucosylceramidase